MGPNETPQLLHDNVILYVENPKDSTQKTLGINEFSKVAGYKVNT